MKINIHIDKTFTLTIKKRTIIGIGLFLCLVSLVNVSAIIVETPIEQITDGGTFSYTFKFDYTNRTGILTLNTVGFSNGSGVYVAEFLVSVAFFDTQPFRLRVFDAETQDYVGGYADEHGTNIKTRKFTLSPNPSSTGVIRSLITITNDDVDVTYQRVSLNYYYDGDAIYIPPGSDGPDVIALDEHERIVKENIRTAVIGVIGGTIFCLTAMVIEIKRVH